MINPDFSTYSPEEAIRNNLRESAIRFSMICEQDLSHMEDLAREIVRDKYKDPDFLSVLPDLAPPHAEADNACIPQNAPAVNRLTALRSTWHSVLLSCAIRRQLEEKTPLTPGFFFPSPTPPDEDAKGKILYQKSAFADGAYLRFSSLISAPRSGYTGSFPAACEAVYHGAGEYCILPVENTTEGNLNAFSRLIDRYGLSIAASCYVSPDSDSERVTRFVLLRRELSPISQPDEHTILEFTLPLGSSPSVAHLLCAAELCGLRPHRIETQSAQTGKSEAQSVQSVHFAFKTKGGDLYAFLLYLYMQAPHFSPVGLYPQLSDQHNKRRR